MPRKLRLGPLGSEAFSIFCELESLSLWLAIWDHFQVELVQIEFSECISDVFDILCVSFVYFARFRKLWLRFSVLVYGVCL